MDNSYQFHRGERCGIEGCRSHRYRVNENGFEECQNGHQHGLAQGAAGVDEDEFLGALRGKRSKAKKEVVDDGANGLGRSMRSEL